MHGFSKEGTAGIMGNIANEASTDLDPTLLEIGSVKKSGLTGTQYTALVDAAVSAVKKSFTALLWVFTVVVDMGMVYAASQILKSSPICANIPLIKGRA